MGPHAQQRKSFSPLSIASTLIFDCACPALTFKLLMRFAVGITQVKALALGSVFPAVRVGAELAKRRRIDFVGTLVLIGIAVAVAVALLGAGPKLFLMRESFVTGALALVALCSLAWHRPLMFYIGRQFAAGDNPIAISAFNSSWQDPVARRAFRQMTAVWAIAWLLEVALRAAMVLNLSVAEVLVVSPIIFNAITIGLVAWTIAYGNRMRRRHDQRAGGQSKSQHPDLN